MAAAPSVSDLLSGGPAPAITIQRAAERTAYVLASGTALFAYDWALTLSDEIHFIWQSHFTVVKILFLVNRYMTLGLLIIVTLDEGGILANSVFVCAAAAPSLAVLVCMLFIVWNWMLAIRVHAICGLKPRIKYFLAIFWIVSSAFTLTLNISVLLWTSREITIPDLKVCARLGLPNNYYALWIPGICYETVLFGMAMVKLLPMRGSPDELRTLFLRNGMLFYATLTSARVANLVLFIKGDPNIVFTVLFLTIGLGSTMVSRMVLNLRQWSRSHEEIEEMLSMINLARRVGDGLLPAPFTYMGPRNCDRCVSVRIVGLQHACDWSAGPRRISRAPNRAGNRGISVQTEVLTIVDDLSLHDDVEVEREPRVAALDPAEPHTNRHQDILYLDDDFSLSMALELMAKHQEDSS